MEVRFICCQDVVCGEKMIVLRARKALPLSKLVGEDYLICRSSLSTQRRVRLRRLNLEHDG